MSEKEKMGCIAAIVLLTPFTAILRGFVLKILWNWFVVPVTGLPELSIPMALGIALIVGFLTYQHIHTDKEDEEVFESIVKGIAISIIHPLFALFFGWLYQLFIQ